MKLFKKYYAEHGGYEGFDFIIFRGKHFSFRWFTDCGEWFIYICFEDKNKVRGYRFSSAGNMKINYTK